MMAKGLGRGFESLIPTELIDEQFDLTAEEDKIHSQLKSLKLSDIVPDEEQPRSEFDEEAIEALAGSIKKHGVLQPIVVTPEDGKYKIVAGERRWRASKLAGLREIPALVRTVDSQNRLEISVIENAQREDLNPLELATAYAKLQSQFNLSVKEIADKIGKKESTVIGTMRLLSLPENAKQVMVKEKLSEGVMRPLINAEQELIDKVLPKIVKEGWTVRQVERYMASTKKKSSAKWVKRDTYRKQEDKITEKYNVEARISGRNLTFHCKSEKQLKELLEKLGG